MADPVFSRTCGLCFSLFAFFLSIVFLPAVEAEASVHFSQAEQLLTLYAKAETSTTGPFLSLDANATLVDKFQPSQGGPASGLTSALASTIGGERASIEFQLPSLPQTYYLNLSKRITGAFYWTSTTAQTGHFEERSQFRLEFFVGTTRFGGVDLANGQGLPPTPPTQNNCVEVPPNINSCQKAVQPILNYLTNGHPTWYDLQFSFRPETAKLEKNQPFVLRITRLSGPLDVHIGTGLDHQTRFKLSYFDLDPVSGTAYLEYGRLATLPDQDSPASSNPASSSPSFNPLVLAGSGTLFLTVRQAGERRRVVVVGLLLLLVATTLGGCLGAGPFSGGPASASDDTGSVPLSTQPATIDGYEYSKALDKMGLGSIAGTLYDPQGIPIHGANVSLAGTTNARTTDADGHFLLDRLVPDDYVLYATAPSGAELEASVTVKRGYIAHLELWLDPTIEKVGASHKHDLWGPRTKIQLVAPTTFTPTFTPASNAVNDPNGGGWTCPAWKADDLRVCESLIPVRFDADPNVPIVPPGTGRVEVLLTWASESLAPRELSLRMDTPLEERVVFVPRESAKPFNLAIFPYEADSGHQTFTNWAFYLRVPYSYQYAVPSTPPVYRGGPITIEVWAHKSVVPYEPPHPDPWNGRNEIPLILPNQQMQNSPGSTSAQKEEYPNVGRGWRLWEDLYKGVLVPPGTLEIRGEFSWQAATVAGSGVGPGTVWRLAFKPANVPRVTPEFFSVALEFNGPNNYTFRIPLKGLNPETGRDGADLVDQFYQLRSNWAFYPDDGEPPGTFSSHDFESVQWKLTATAVRDPEWPGPV